MPVREVVVDRDVRSPLDLSPRSLLNRYYLRRTVSILTLLLMDCASIVCAVLIVDAAFRTSVSPELDAPAAADLAIATLITIVVFTSNRLYGLRHERHSLRRLVVASGESVVLVVLLAALTQREPGVANIGVIWAFALLLALAARSLYDWCLGRVYGVSDLRPVLVVGHADGCVKAERLIAQCAPATHCRVAGIITDDDVSEDWQRTTGLTRLGDLERLEAVARLEAATEIIVTDADTARENIGALLDLCRRCHMVLKLAAFDLDLGASRLTYVPGFGVPLFVIKPPALAGSAFLLKRVVDVVASSLMLVVLAPVAAVIAVAIKVTSPGPVFFVDRRVGLGQRPFRCYKFRTMCADAMEQQAALEAFNEADGAIFKIRDDPRVTRVGRCLRRYSLDELPQLWNVLKGDMSLVGPRPLPLRDFQLLEDEYKQRHVVLPGMTGLWQVSGRSKLSFDDMIALDTRYIEEWSIGTDLSILARTVGAVLHVKGAY